MSAKSSSILIALLVVAMAGNFRISRPAFRLHASLSRLIWNSVINKRFTRSFSTIHKLYFSSTIYMHGCHLTAVALSDRSIFRDTISGPVCETCKQRTRQTKTEIPIIKPQIELLCHLSGTTDDIKTCIKLIDSALMSMANKTPENTCQTLGMCPSVKPW